MTNDIAAADGGNCSAILRDLIARLEKATTRDYDIDRDIAKLMGWQYDERRHHLPWKSPDGITYQHPPFYTESIDAALTLVPEGLSGSIAFGKYNGAILYTRDVRKHLGECRGATLAIALCIACLRARLSQATPTPNADHSTRLSHE